MFGRGRRVDQGLRAQFYQAVKLYSFIRNERDKRMRERDTKGQEKSYMRDFWAFSKKAVNGLLDKEVGKPTFNCDFAYNWFRNRYSTPVSISQEAISWFPQIPVPQKEFNMGAVRPQDIRSVLSKKKAGSSPGDDGILNGHLKHLESTHHFLATLFTKTLLSSPHPWEG